MRRPARACRRLRTRLHVIGEVPLAVIKLPPVAASSGSPGVKSGLAGGPARGPECARDRGEVEPIDDAADVEVCGGVPLWFTGPGSECARDRGEVTPVDDAVGVQATHQGWRH